MQRYERAGDVEEGGGRNQRERESRVSSAQERNQILNPVGSKMGYFLTILISWPENDCHFLFNNLYPLWTTAGRLGAFDG